MSSTSVVHRAPGEDEALTVRFIAPVPHVLLATVQGDLDLATAPRLDREVPAELRRRRPRWLVMDLSGLEFLGLHGIAVFERLRREAAVDGVGLVLVAMPAAGERALRFAGLLDRFSRHIDLGAALAAIGEGLRPTLPAARGPSGSSEGCLPDVPVAERSGNARCSPRASG